jgi:CDP-glycerol glycerophosphotransferase (TagB/SpsB family)
VLVFALVARLTAGRRDDDLWVFGARGGDGFVDNAKYLYLHVAHERPEVRPVWLSKDRATVRRLRANGYRAHHAYSPAGIATSLRAGVVAITQGLGDVNIACSGGATVVDLWHGIPLKTISWDAEFLDRSLAFRLAHDYLSRQVDLLTIPGTATVEPFRTGLRIPPDRMVATGYPRTDALFDRVPGEEVGLSTAAHRAVERLAADHPVVLYLPTYREDDGDPVDEQFDPDRLVPLLETHDAYLFVKTHPFEPFELPGDHDRVRQLPPDTDVYPFLRLADVLVTDYSSVFFDFLVADDPIVFYPYDLDRYRASRGTYFDYESVTPGPVATDFDDLLSALDATLERDEFASERRAVRERFLAHPEPGRAAAVYQAIRERSDLGSPSQPSR